MLTKTLICQREHKMYLKSCWGKNVSQHVLTKPLPCHQKCHPKPTHASDYIKCISTCVDQIPPMPERKQNESQYVMTKLMQGQLVHKMHIYMCWPNPFLASEDTKCSSTCIGQAHPMPTKLINANHHVLTKSIKWTQNAYQRMLTKSIPYH